MNATNTPTTSAQGGFNANRSLQQMYQMGLRIAQNICNVVTAPVEYALRPHFGTRYFDPIQMLLTWLLMAGLPLVGGLAGSVPFATPTSPDGLIGLGTLSFLFFASHVIHGPRIWRRMIQMNREQHSEFEGDAWPLFHRLPLAQNFWLVRIIHEPVFLLIVAFILRLAHVFNRAVAVYLVIAALLLSLKNALAWYQNWLHIRALMDAKFAGPLLAKAASGRATERELAQVHMAGFPRSVPADIRTAAIAEMAPPMPSLPADIAGLLSPVEPEAPQAA